MPPQPSALAAVLSRRTHTRVLSDSKALHYRARLVHRPFDLLQTHGGHLLKLAWNLRFTFQRGEKALGPVFDIVM